jgi:hypothetical protein
MWLAREIEHAACGRFDGDVVRATVAFDIELFNLERLRVPDARRGNACCEEDRGHDLDDSPVFYFRAGENLF